MLLTYFLLCIRYTINNIVIVCDRVYCVHGIMTSSYRRRLFFLFVFAASISYAQDNVYDVARKGCADDMKQIIEAYPDVINYKNKNGHTPLILACYRGNAEVVEILVDHVDDIDAISDYGTALMASAFKGNVSITKLLLDHGANVNATSIFIVDKNWCRQQKLV